MLPYDEDNEDECCGSGRQRKVKDEKKKDKVNGDLSFIRNFNEFGMKPKLDRRG